MVRNRSTRERGIKASPYKLTKARKAAGFASQAAVAEKIADAEGLVNPPKDVVNRAFKGVKVSPDTIERLALALGVPSHALLLTTDEDELMTPPSGASRQRIPFGRWPGVAMVAAVLVLGLLVYWISSGQGDQQRVVASPDFSIAELAPLAKPESSLMVLPTSTLNGDALAQAVRRGLASEFTIVSAAATQLHTDALNDRVANTIETDARLLIAVETVGRWRGVIAFVEYDNARHQVWAESLPVYRFEEQLEVLAERLSVAVLVATTRTAPPPGFSFPTATALAEYLAGQSLLDEPASELNLQRAQSRFEAAVRHDGQFADAHAGLCRALIEKYWMLDEMRAIEDASMTCAQAQQLAAEKPAVIIARSRLLQVTGKNDEAIALLDDWLLQHPDDVDALLAMLTSRLTQFETTGDRAALSLGRAAAQKAVRNDDVIWQPFFHLGRLEFYANDIAAAIAATQSGIQRSENGFLLVSLGTYQTCAGEFDSAASSIERARDDSPGVYIGDEFLGQLKYFRGQFDESLTLRQRAIDSFEGGEPRVHDMWGSLADSFRQTGQVDDAVEAYRTAASIVETDLLHGNASMAARAARLYYYGQLSAMASDILSISVQNQLRAELDDVADAQTEAAGFRYMAMAYALNGKTGKARQFLEKATTRCPGYRRHPDIIALQIL